LVVKARPAQVRAREIDLALEQLRRSSLALDADGTSVLVSLRASLGEVPLLGVGRSDWPVGLGEAPKVLERAIDEALRGASSTMISDHVRLDVRVHDERLRQMTDLELVRGLGLRDTATLRSFVRALLEEQARENADAKVIANAVAHVSARRHVEIDDVLTRRAFARQLERFLSRELGRGVVLPALSPEELEQVYTRCAPAFAAEVRAGAIVGGLGALLEVRVAPEEVEAYLDHLAAALGVPADDSAATRTLAYTRLWRRALAQALRGLPKSGAALA
jgi:hypothetical protein